MINSLPLLLLLPLCLCLSPVPNPHPRFTAFSSPSSSSHPPRPARWLGPSWFASPLWSHRISSSNALLIDCAHPVRLASLLPISVNTKGALFSLSLTLSFTATSSSSAPSTAGFRVGRRGRLRDWRQSLLSPSTFIDATLSTSGTLSLDARTKHVSFINNQSSAVTLTLYGSRLSSESIRLTLVVVSPPTSNGSFIKRQQQRVALSKVLPLKAVRGQLSLMCTGPYARIDDLLSRKVRRAKMSNFVAKGSLLTHRPRRIFGPILWVQFLVSRAVLRLQVQLAPVPTRPTQRVHLYLPTANRSQTLVQTVAVRRSSWTALFTIPAPVPLSSSSSSKAAPFTVRTTWAGQTYKLTGTIPYEKRTNGKNKVKLAVFSCDKGYTFPNAALVSHVIDVVKPDILFFAGDQFYENGPYGVPRRTALSNNNALKRAHRLDFLYKHIQFGWTWRRAFRSIPVIITPDDHDVYHPNLWGAGGIRVPPGRPEDAGGYLMSGQFVNVVHDIQSGHLPPLAARLARGTAVNRTLPIGIKARFTEVWYAGLSFAVLEDRKFKTGPMQLPAGRVRELGIGGELLGRGQEKFLYNWCNSNDDDENIIRLALSQTMFGTVSTHAGPALRRNRYYFDGGGWPLAPRDRVVRMMRQCGVLSVHGDQHLGMLARLGVDAFDDGNLAFMVPGTANGWPRAWWPSGPRGNNTGRFFDDTGAPITVLAVANPARGSNLLDVEGVPGNPLDVAFRRGSGFGLLVVDKKRRRVKVNLFRVGGRKQLRRQFDGFPKTVALDRRRVDGDGERERDKGGQRVKNQGVMKKKKKKIGK